MPGHRGGLLARVVFLVTLPLVLVVTSLRILRMLAASLIGVASGVDGVVVVMLVVPTFHWRSWRWRWWWCCCLSRAAAALSAGIGSGLLCAVAVVADRWLTSDAASGATTLRY